MALNGYRVVTSRPRPGEGRWSRGFRDLNLAEITMSTKTPAMSRRTPMVLSIESNQDIYVRP